MSRFSVVLCSRNRDDQVRKCLAELDVDPIRLHGGEIVLVDSASTDKTPEIMSEFIRNNPEVRSTLVSVDEPGLSIARNAGVGASSGAIIVFLDDDVYLGEGYISKVLERFEKLSPHVGFISGQILLLDPTDSRYGCKFGTKYWERSPGSTVRPGLFQGTNFCAKREVYDQVGGFDDELGAGKKYRCEDVDFVARALAAGFCGAFDPNLVVYHHHGRKDGEDTIALDQANLYAAGAFYSKMVRQKRIAYLLNAMAHSVLLSGKRLLPLRTKLASGLLAFRSFWSGFRDYRHDSRQEA